MGQIYMWARYVYEDDIWTIYGYTTIYDMRTIYGLDVYEEERMRWKDGGRRIDRMKLE